LPKKKKHCFSSFWGQIEEMVTNMIHFGYGIAEIVFIWIELSF